jgi:signal recognition particle subunit SEC65
LVDKSKDNRLDSEIEKRLADLFGEEDMSFGEENPIEEKDTVAEDNKSEEEQAPAEDEDIFDLTEAVTEESVGEGATDDYPLAELKNLVLSIDWEITEEALTDFLAQVDSLKSTYKNEKIILTFLQLLGSLGVYIQTNRGNAHPKTFKILNSVFSRLEEVVRSANMTVAEKKKLLRTEMNKYKQLRNQVSKKKAAKVSRKEIISAPRELESLIKAPRQKEAARSGRKVTEKAASKSGEPVSDALQSIANLAEAVEELKKFIHSELNALKQELRILHKSK